VTFQFKWRIFIPEKQNQEKIADKIELAFSSKKASESHRSNLREKKRKKMCIKTRVYLSLISFDDCQSPWMLHIETAMRFPGLLVFIQLVIAWWVYTVLVLGPWAEAPCAPNSYRPIWWGNFSPSGKKNSVIQLIWCSVVLGWAISFPIVTLTSKRSSAFIASAQSITGTCFSAFQSASWTNSPIFFKNNHYHNTSLNIEIYAFRLCSWRMRYLKKLSFWASKNRLN